MIAGGPAMGAVGHEAFTPEQASVVTGWDRLGIAGLSRVPFRPAESCGGAS